MFFFLTPDSCQRTRSFYGYMSIIMTHGMNNHCEHHDHPRIPAYRLPEVRRLYPEFYDNLKSYDWYFEPWWPYVRDRGVGWRYASCA